ncbi:MAG: hypothetical protein GOV01_01550 [Candidatus Altiarchaeota archaeon]|nr:hypothetical protein [Candidatus Altiarchaeota archaeon]
MEILVDEAELKKIELKFGQLKRVGKDKLKWLIPPEWAEKTLEGIVVEVPTDMAAQIFEKFKVKTLRKK